MIKKDALTLSAEINTVLVYLEKKDLKVNKYL